MPTCARDLPPRGSQLPLTWFPHQAERAYAVERGLDPDATAERFAAYWHGEGGWKADWSSVWRKWCLDQVERDRRAARAGPKPQRMSKDEQMMRDAGLWREPDGHAGPTVDHAELTRSVLQ